MCCLSSVTHSVHCKFHILRGLFLFNWPTSVPPSKIRPKSPPQHFVSSFKGHPIVSYLLLTVFVERKGKVRSGTKCTRNYIHFVETTFFRTTHGNQVFIEKVKLCATLFFCNMLIINIINCLLQTLFRLVANDFPKEKNL